MAYRRTNKKRTYKKRTYKKRTYGKRAYNKPKYARKRKYSRKGYKKTSVLRIPTKTLVVPDGSKEKLFSSMPDVQTTVNAINQLAGELATKTMAAEKQKMYDNSTLLTKIKTELEPSIRESKRVKIETM